MSSMSSTMRGFRLRGGFGEMADLPLPTVNYGEALVRVTRAGICNTDLEIMKGYEIAHDRFLTSSRSPILS